MNTYTITLCTFSIKTFFIQIMKRRQILELYMFSQLSQIKVLPPKIMIVQNKQYDTYCTHPECIQNQNALFFYTPNNYHQRNSHEVQILHPLKVKSVIQSLPQNQQNPLLNEKAQLIKRVEGYIRQFCDRMNSFVIQKYLSPFVNAAKAEVQGIKINNEDQVFSRLQKGDHQTLKEYINCCKNGVNNAYPLHNYAKNKIIEIDTTIAKQMEELYVAFQKIIAVTFERKEDFLKVAEGQFQTLSDLGKDQLRKTFKLDQMSLRSRISNKIQNENIQKYVEAQSSIELIMENENCSNDLLRKNRKRKPIQKADKKMKTTSQFRRAEERRSPKSIDIHSEITQIAADEVRINTCSNIQVTLNYILQHYKDLTKIHIFDHKFAKKEIIERLFNKYKNLKVITLNCAHQFESKVMNRQNLQKIENLELKWDFNNFFKEYHIFQYFPTINRKFIQNIKRTNTDLNLLLAMKNNQSLSINFEKQIDELVNTSFRFENIKTLHYTKAWEEKQRTPMPLFSKVLKFEFSQLTTLNLSQINLCDCDRQFGQFLKKNRDITTLVMSYCKIHITNVYNPAKIFQYLRELPFLKKFSYSPKNSEEYVKAENIFCLTNLEELHLFKCNLLGITNKSYEDSSMLREIKNLRKLSQLSLYACNPIFFDFFSYMEKGTLERIQYLNIGYTQVENDFASTILPIMTRLKYLNIDSTYIDSKSLLAGFQAYCTIHQKESPLQYLSIQSTLHPYHFDIAEFKGLSAFIPNLVYVEISSCRSLRGYGFEEYKSLKYLVVDYEQQCLVQKKVSPNVQIINLN